MNDSIDRADWDALADHFERFFRGIGDVIIDADRAIFAAPQAGTGLDSPRSDDAVCSRVALAAPRQQTRTAGQTIQYERNLL